MKIACLCCTYRRSDLLGEMIACYESQDYPLENRELIILDDAGEYNNMSGPGWQLLSIPRRFASLGDKRNAVAALVSPDVEAFSIWDDDDLYLPHALSTIAEGLRISAFLRPSRVYLNRFGVMSVKETCGLYHGGWAFLRSAFESVRGYQSLNNGEDQDLSARLIAAGFASSDPLADGRRPYYHYRENTGSYHLSWMGIGEKPWSDLGKLQPAREKRGLNVTLPPILQNTNRVEMLLGRQLY